MATTKNLIQSISNNNYVEAKAQFIDIIADKMRNVLAQEYRNVAQNYVKEDVTQVGPDPSADIEEGMNALRATKGQMTKSEAVKKIKSLGLAGKWDNEWQEFVVDFKKGDPRRTNDSSYRTDDPEDAVNTAAAMSKMKAGSSSSIEEATIDPAKAKQMIANIRRGDRVTIAMPLRGSDTKPQLRSGKAVMPSSHGGWVLNMGGAHGTPGIADEDNIVSVSKGRQ